MPTRDEIAVEVAHVFCRTCLGRGLLFKHASGSDMYASDQKCDSCAGTGRVVDPQLVIKVAAALDRYAAGLRADMRFLLGLVPEWAKVSQQRMDPAFYGTSTYEGDLKVIERIKDIIKAIQGGEGR